jgi:hypothetical protein
MAQKAVVEWWGFSNRGFGVPEELLLSIPNGSFMGGGFMRTKRGMVPLAVVRANRMKAEGLRPGAPDLLLLCPNQTHHALLVEMKSEEGRVRPEQKQFMEDARKFGYDCVVAHSTDEAREAITRYLEKR